LTILPAPRKPEIVGTDKVSVYQTEIYTLPENNGFQNNWSTVHGEIVAESENEVEIFWSETGTGYVYLTIINQHDCASDIEKRISISEGFTDVVEAVENNIRIYPNPANSILCIDYAEEFSLEIYTISGELILVSNNTTNNISALFPGVYIVTIRNSNKRSIYTDKLIVE
jgi:hypothetical protein